MGRSFKIEYVFLGNALAIALAAYILTSGKIVDHDAFIMGEVAQRLAGGKSLYIEAWDNKPPLAFLFYYPSQALVPHSYLAQQIFTFFWTAGQALAVFFLLCGEKLWIRVVIAAVVLWMPLTRTDFAWGSSEDAVNGFTILLAVLGYRILRDDRINWGLWFVCGLAAGFAFHSRQPGILFMGLPLTALVISPHLWKEKISTVAISVAGCAVAFGIVIGIMLMISDWNSYIDIMLNKPIQYSGVKSHVEGGVISNDFLSEHSINVGSVIWGFITLLQDNFHVIRSVFLEHFGKLAMDILFVIPVLAIFLTTGWRWRLFAAMSICIGMGVVLLPMKLFSHYHQQMIPVFAIGSLFLFRRLDEASPHLAKSLAVGLLGIMLLKVILTAEVLRFDNGEQAEMDQVVRVIESESREEDRLFAVGRNSAYIYYRATMEPCHKIHWDMFFGWLAIYLPVNVETVMDSIVEKPPSWIVIDSSAHEKYLLHPNAAEEGKVRIGELLRRLHKKHPYESINRIGRWRILQRKTLEKSKQIRR